MKNEIMIKPGTQSATVTSLSDNVLEGILDISDIRSMTIQVSGTFSLSLVVEVSNDPGAYPTTWDTIETVSAPGMYSMPLAFRALRVRCSSYFNGSANVSALFSQEQALAEDPMKNTENEELFVFDTNLSDVLGSVPLSDGNGTLNVSGKVSGKRINGRIGSLNEQYGIDCYGYQTVICQLAGIWAGQIMFEATANDGDFQTIIGTNTVGQPTSAIAGTSTANANGIYRFSVAGLSRFRVRFSTFTSGTATVTLAVTAGIMQDAAARRAPGQTYWNELYTYDLSMNTAIGGSQLYRTGFELESERIQAPTVNPTMPTTYPAPQFAKYPQIFRRLRVESGGDQKLPFAQEANTNRIIVSTPDAVRLLEEILLELKTLNSSNPRETGLIEQPSP